MSRRGFMSPARAARILGVHRNTVYGWAIAAVEGEDSRLSEVERHPVTGRLEIATEDIKGILESNDETDAEK